jgi:ubiquinone/menaquinone biosynthesis C-methylase UbiE
MSVKTHEIVILDHKPADTEIRRMVQEYFESEAAHYDAYNAATEKRNKFIGRMNELIAQDLAPHSLTSKVLSVACGTGFRESWIRQTSGLSFSITGVDVSPAMCTEARKVGLDVIESDWLSADLGNNRFDAGFFLYSIGLVPSHEARRDELKKIAKHLKPGAPFYIDIMNLDDKNEWGPELRQVYAEKALRDKGYDLGDTFYRRIGSEKTAYYHYFTETEAVSLLEECGFRVESRHYIDCSQNYGALVGPDEGAVLFILRRI